MSVEYIAARMAREISINPNAANAVFIREGRYHVETFPMVRDSALEDGVTLDEMIHRMETYNADPTADSVCIYVSVPNRVLRCLNDGDVASMISYCKPMATPKPSHINIKDGTSGWEYALPDRRQTAADIVSENVELVPMVSEILDTDAYVDLDGTIHSGSFEDVAA